MKKNITVADFIISILIFSFVITVLFALCLREINETKTEIDRLNLFILKQDSIMNCYDSLIISLHDILIHEIAYDNDSRDYEIIDLYNKVEKINSYLEREPEFKE